MKTSNLLSLIGAAGIALAHPGHIEPEHELIYKRNYNTHARRGLQACASKLQARGVFDKAQARRAATVEKYRKELDLKKRDTDTVANTSHLSNSSYTPDTDETTIFGESNDCVINPEGETGPYWVKGEYLRSNLRENQTGVPIVIEGQFLDIETCEPLTNVWWDIWNCNATGVYSGVVEEGNGNTADASNINATFLRGVQKTDEDGVVTFESVFPGHYSGRATHHHMAVHLDATVEANNTLSGGTFAHVGQVFWDQDLIDKVEATSPYNTNTIAITENVDDRVFATETADTTSDPVFEYVYLGDDLSDGLFGWVTVVVNTSATYDPAYSFVLTEDGGVAESGGTDSVDGVIGGAAGNMTGGSSPSGSMSGMPPSGSGAVSINGTASVPSGTASGSQTVNTSTSVSASASAASYTGGASAAVMSSTGEISSSRTLCASSSTSKASASRYSSSPDSSHGASSGKSQGFAKANPWWHGSSNGRNGRQNSDVEDNE